ncbi:MAG TPA: hypothetical protein PKX16_02210 [Kiritimatiellia bacterium]|nr:hypothetical protein [Kiritimatiellia bacterium]
MGAIEELLGRRVFDDHAVVHEEHAVGDLAGEAHFVRDDHHRPAPAGQVLHHVGIHGQGAGDGDALLLAAGEVAGPGRDLRGQAQLDRRENHVVEGGLVFEEIEMLKHHPDLAAQAVHIHPLGKDILVLDPDMPAVDMLQAIDTLQQCRLARARRADDAHDFARGHFQVDTLEHLVQPESLVQVGDLDHRTGQGRHREGAHRSCPQLRRRSNCCSNAEMPRVSTR